MPSAEPLRGPEGLEATQLVWGSWCQGVFVGIISISPLQVSLFGRRAVSLPRPAFSPGAARSGGQHRPAPGPDHPFANRLRRDLRPVRRHPGHAIRRRVARRRPGIARGQNRACRLSKRRGVLESARASAILLIQHDPGPSGGDAGFNTGQLRDVGSPRALVPCRSTAGPFPQGRSTSSWARETATRGASPA